MRLGTGPGKGPRLYAPGVPDWIGADGAHVLWVLRDRLFVLSAKEVRVVELPDLVEDVVADRAGVVVALARGFVRVDVAKGKVVAACLDEEADPVTTRPGVDLGLFVRVPSHKLVDLATGTDVPLPDAATRARFFRPWASGRGAAWVDFDHLYRLGARIEAIGKAPKTAGLAVGPGGGCVVQLESDTLVAPPRGLAQKLGTKVNAASVRFHPDGREALAAHADGVVRLDLAEGRVLEEWEGHLAPVGWAPEVRLLDLDAGALLDGRREVLMEGFAGARAALAGSTLAGPGGAVWELTTGERRGGGWSGGACAIDGARAVHVDEHGLALLGGGRVRHAAVGDDDEVDWARLDGEAVVIGTAAGEVVRVSLADGTARKPGRTKSPPRPPRAPEGVRWSEPEDPSAVVVDGKAWPLPADGAARVGQEVWIWSDEGLLAQLPPAGAGVPDA